MKKKITAILLVVALVAVAVAGSTMAYFTDDASDVNVMTVGNVKIEQHEYERTVNADGTYATKTIDNVTSYVLQDFTQGKPLFPIVGDPSLSGDDPAYAGWDSTTVRMTQVGSYGGMQVFAGKNAIDKFVVVENTGNSDAYIRTLVAIEVGTGDPALVGTSYHGTWTSNDIGVINIDGNNYYLKEYVYNGGQLSDGSWRHEGGVLPAGDIAYPSLCQVYLKSAATNEDAEALDGNGNGTHDILVLSQAVQTAGFADAATALDAAFGDVDAANAAAWFGGDEFAIPTVVDTDNELIEALKNGKDVVLTADITVDTDVNVAIAKGTAASINLNGHTITGTSAATGKNRNLFTVKGDLTVTNGTVEMTHTGDNMGWNNLVSAFSVEGGELTLDGVTINVSGSDMAYGVDVNTTLGETVLNISNSNITSTYTAVRIFNNHKTATGTVNLNSGVLDGGSRDIWVHNPSAKAVDANGIVNIAEGYTYTVTVQDTFFDSRIYQID